MSETLKSIFNHKGVRIVLSAMLVGWPIPSDAETISWIDPDGGIYSTVSNWSPLPNRPDRVPGPSDTAVFGLTNPPSFQRVYTVSFVTDPTTGSLQIEDDRVTFNMNGHVLNLPFVSALNVGTSSAASGRLTINNGTVAFPNDSLARIGFFATGYLTVGSGGLLAGSLAELKVGNAGLGVVRLENGGDVLMDEVNIGFSNAPGEATVTGTGSTIIANSIVVGTSGVGTLDIAAQGRVETLSSTIGLGNTLTGRGTVTVQGAGSRWTAGNLTVGRLDDGQLNITDGGLVTCTQALLSSSQDLNALPGTVTVAGADSTFQVNGRLDVGSTVLGKGSLRIQPGGTTRVTQDTQIGFRGLIQLEGGTFHSPEITFANAEASATQFQWSSGTLHVGSFQGDLVNAGGVLAPGASAGTTTISGDYQHRSGATLQTEIGGTAPGTQFDRVNVSSDVLLEGTLQLDLLNGFVPAASDLFTIMEISGSLTGSFANVANGRRLATTNGIGSFVVNYGAASANSSEIVLSDFLAGRLPGDFNNDSIVNAADIDLLCDAIPGGPTNPYDVDHDNDVDLADLEYHVEQILKTTFGDTDTDGDVDLNDLGNVASGFGVPGQTRWSKGNFDCDNDVDLNDLGTLASNFGAGRAEALAAFEALVPEPAAGGILMFVPGVRSRRRLRGDGQSAMLISRFTF